MSQLINVKTDILLLHGWPKKTLVQNISGACISKRRMQAGHENVVKVKAKFIRKGIHCQLTQNGLSLEQE
jgi:hypothetical protein